MKIVSESAVAGGVRRIEAVTQKGARKWMTEKDNQLSAVAQLLKTAPEQVAERVAALIDDRKKLERDMSELRKKLATGGGASQEAETIGNIQFIGKILDDVPAKDLKPMADELKSSGSGLVIALIARSDDKASIVVSVSADATDSFNAVDLVKIGSSALGGKGGGGRPDMAQAGGPNGAAAEAALTAIKEALSS